MRKIITGLILFALGVGAIWWLFFRSSSVEVTWGGNWPATIRGVGTSVEQIEIGSSHKVTAADRARALERARWKAYYYAQLRFAEQLGGLKLNANTTVHDAVLADRKLQATFAKTIRAAAEVASESKNENLGNAVRATVVVAAPAERMISFREALAHALATGKIRLSRRYGSSVKRSGAAVPAVQWASPTPRVERTTAISKGRPPVVHRPLRHVVIHHAQRFSGCVLHLPESSDTLVAAPDFYDAAGRFLGSALELPSTVRAEGLPVASPADTVRIKRFAGRYPLDVWATVAAGNIVLQRKFNRDEAEQFAEAIRSNRVVLVLEKENG